jgi:hypothetical protein
MRPTLDGHELSDEQLAQIRKQVEGFDTIDALTDEMRELIEMQWPDLAWKLPPKPGERRQ